MPIFKNFDHAGTAAALLDPDASRAALDQVNRNYSTEGLYDTLLAVNGLKNAEEQDRRLKTAAEEQVLAGTARYFPGSGTYVDKIGRKIYKDNLFQEQFRAEQEDYENAKKLGFNRDQHKLANDWLAAAERLKNIESQQYILRNNGLSNQADALETERQAIMGENSRRMAALGEKANLLGAFKNTRKNWLDKMADYSKVPVLINKYSSALVNDDNLYKGINPEQARKTERPLDVNGISTEKRGAAENAKDVFTDPSNIPFAGIPIKIAKNAQLTGMAKRVQLGIDYYTAALKKQMPEASEIQIRSMAENAMQNDQNGLLEWWNENQEKELRGNSMLGTGTGIALQSIPFITEFILSGGAGGAAAAAAKAAAKKMTGRAIAGTVKGLAKGGLKNIGRSTLRTLGDIGYQTAIRAPYIAAKGVSEGTERYAQDAIRQDDSGNFEFDYNQDLGSHIANATVDQAIEVASEASGQSLRLLMPNGVRRALVRSRIGAAVPGVGRGAMERMAGAFLRLPGQRMIRKLNKLTAFNGVLGEMYEERIGGILRGILGVNSNKGILERIEKEFPTTEELITEFGAFAATDVLFRGFGSGVNAVKKWRKEMIADIAKTAEEVLRERQNGGERQDEAQSENVPQAEVLGNPQAPVERFDSDGQSREIAVPFQEPEAEERDGLPGQRPENELDQQMPEVPDAAEEVLPSETPETPEEISSPDPHSGISKILERARKVYTPGEAYNTRKVLKRVEKDYRRQFGNVLSADNVKLMFKDEGYNPHDEKSVVEYHKKAGPITGKLFDEFLKTRKGKGNGTVIFTGGGNGSGKSSVLGAEAAAKADFVMDSTMVNRDAAWDSIQKVIDNGQIPVLTFAYRDPADAWFNGVQKRNESEDGHIVPKNTFANTHSKAKENFIALVEEFGDKAKYIIRESLPGNTSRDMTLDELKTKPSYTKDQILEIINDKRRVGDLEEGIQRGMRPESESDSQRRPSESNERGNAEAGSAERLPEENPERNSGRTERVEEGIKPTESEIINGDNITTEQGTTGQDHGGIRRSGQPAGETSRGGFDSLGNENGETEAGRFDGRTETAAQGLSSTGERDASGKDLKDGKGPVGPVGPVGPRTEEQAAENASSGEKQPETPQKETEKEINRKLSEKYQGASVKFVDKPNQTQAAVADFFKKNLGRDVVFYSGTIKADGFSYQDKLYVNTDNSKPLMATAFHEFTHDLKRSDPAVYKELFDSVLELAPEERLASWKADYNRRYTGNNYKPLEDSALEEEFIADVVGDIGGSAKFLKEAGKRHPNLLKRFLEWIKRLKNALYRNGAFDADVRKVLEGQFERAEKIVQKSIQRKWTVKEETGKNGERKKSDSQFLREHVIVGGIPKTEQQQEGNENESKRNSGGPVRDGASPASGGVRKEQAAGNDRGGNDSEGAGEGVEERVARDEGSENEPVSSAGRSGGTGTGRRDLERGSSSRGKLVEEGGSGKSQPVVEENIPGGNKPALSGTDAGSPGDASGVGAGDGGRGRRELRSGDTDGDSGEVRQVKGPNHRILDSDTLIAGGDAAKTNANLKAIRLLKKLEKENRDATPEEQKVLAQYSGWGGLPSVFQFGSRHYSEVRELLTSEEYAAARASTINAHYTERAVIRNMWEIAERLGFKGGKVGEFGAGVGHFLGMVPEKLYDKTGFHAVELDSVSGRILSKLYPRAEVTVRGLQDIKIKNNSLDMVIGNFPFAKDGPYDKNYPKLSLHNYFFARAVDAVKPGGLVVAVTSASTMDNDASLRAREFIAGKADLVGAIRLPEDAFKKNAGTSVVTDIVILRKKDGSPFAGEAFQSSVPMETADHTGTARVNEYFQRHPDMMLGTLSNSGSMYRGNEQTLLSSGNLEEQLPEAVRKLRKNVFGTAVPAENKIELSAEETGRFKNFEIFEKNGELYQMNGDTPEKLKNGKTPLSVKEKEKVKSYLKLKEAFNKVINDMLNDESDSPALKKDRKAMEELYDAHVKKFGHIADAGKNRILREDPNYLRISGLENKEGTGKNVVYTKSDIFTKRTIFRTSVPDHADSITDAASISVNRYGYINLPYVAKLIGKTEADAGKELLDTGKFFENPADGRIESASRYLSGNVAEKLKIAREQGMERNVSALEKALPVRKEIGTIGFQLGSSWMPPEVVNAWAKKTLGVPVEVKYNQTADRWKVDCPARYRISKFKGERFDAIDILEHALNLQNYVVRYKVDDKYIVDQDATVMARQMREEMMNSFKDFVNTDSDAAKQTEDAFNSKVNVYTPRIYDLPDNQFYPNAAHIVDGKEFSLRDHQKRLVSRCMEGNTLIAHCVGAGKTYAMITAAMELKRTSLAHKNLIVVQNATLEQFADSIMKLYPNSKTLVASKKDLEGEKRKRFMSRVATGDWDIVVMAQSSFNMIPDKPEFEREQNLKMIEEYEQIIADLEQEDKWGNRNAVKDIERQKKRLEERNKKLSDRKKDDVLYFDELGFDSMFIDEAHEYKKNAFVTKMPNIKGLDKGSSQKAYSLSLKIQQTMQKNGGRNIFLATGTPITNTLTEIWNMVRYLSPKSLADFNVETFDRFASLFTQTVQGMEIDAAGRFRIVERFAQYNNVEELGKLFSSVSDIVLPSDLKGVKRPPVKGGAAQPVVIQRSETIGRFMNYLADYYSWFEGLSGKEKRENSYVPLQIYGWAKKASIDLRLINSSLPDDKDSKLNHAVRNITEKYKEYNGVKGAQVVFFDLYQSPDGKFNAYQELKKKLIEQKIPEKEIAVITDYNTDLQRQELFKQVNDGIVRVVIGSTTKLGVGVNMQERLACAHHLDAPSRPSDMEQRNGRIIRQGNSIPEVEIFNYAIDQTLDAGSYQMLARKDKFIKSVMRGVGGNSQEVEDTDSIDYASFSAMISGNPKAMRKIEVDAQVKKLSALKDQNYKNMRQLQNDNFSLERNLDFYQKSIEKVQKFIDKYGGTSFKTNVSLEFKGEKAQGERKVIAGALDKIIDRAMKESDGYQFELKLNGIPLKFRVRSEDLYKKLGYSLEEDLGVSSVRQGSADITAGSGLLNSLSSLIAAKPEELDRLKQEIPATKQRIENNNREIEKGFPYQAELEKALTEQSELIRELKTDGRKESRIEVRPYLNEYINGAELVSEADVSIDESVGEIPLSVKKGNYSVDPEVREAAKKKIRELFHEKNIPQNEIIKFGRFSRAVVDALKEFIPEINYEAEMSLRGSDFNHIRNRHPEHSIQDLMSMVNLFDHPSKVGYEYVHRTKIIWFIDEEKNNSVGINFYGAKKNMGWIKTFYQVENLDKSIKKRGIQQVTVANSVIKDDSSNTEANSARTRSLPLDNIIPQNRENVKRETDLKDEKDDLKLSIKPEEIAEKAETSLREAVKETFRKKDRSERPEISKLARFFGTIQFYAEKVPALKRMFHHGMGFADNKALLERSLYSSTGRNDDLDAILEFKRGNAGEYKKFADYVFQRDRDAYGYTVTENGDRFDIIDPDGKFTGSSENESDAWNRAFMQEAEGILCLIFICSVYG